VASFVFKKCVHFDFLPPFRRLVTVMRPKASLHNENPDITVVLRTF
jgi:hypothetical protein